MPSNIATSSAVSATSLLGAARQRWVPGLLAAALVAGVSATPAAHAQLEEVVVTAERREASQQTVPVAITAITAQTMNERLITNVHDLQYQVPNISIARNTGTASGARLFLRGIGEDESRVTADPAIGIYVDGVYLGRQTGSMLDLLDLERIEVLRGPQGTLYGRNSNAGAIKLVSKKPEHDNNLTLGITVGSEGRADLRAHGNWDISDSVAARGTLLQRSRNGLHTIRPIGDVPTSEVGEIDVVAARLAFLFDFSDDWSAHLAIDRSNDDSDPVPDSRAPPQDRDNNLFTTEPVPGNPDPDAMLVTETTIDGAASDSMFDASAICRSQTRYYVADGTTTVSVSGANTSGPITAMGCYANYSSTVNQSGLSLALTGDVGGYTLSLLTGVRQLDDDLSTRIGFPFTQKTDQDQLSQEVSIASNYDGPFNFIGGLYYFSEDVRLDSVFVLPHLIDLETSSNALFLHGNYGFGDALTLTAGLRYTDETKKLDAAGPFSMARSESGDFSSTSYKLALDYRISDDVMVYGSLTTGFKSGGWSPDCFAATACFLPVDEEEVQTLEFGLRSDWLNNRLRVNATAFLNTYDDLQIAASVPGLGFTRFNVTEAETSGLELELVFQPTDNLRFNAAIGMLDGEYTSLTVPQAQGLTNANLGTGTTSSNCALGDTGTTLAAAQKAIDDVVKEGDTVTDEMTAALATATGNFNPNVLSCAYNLSLKNAPEMQISFGAHYTVSLMGGELALSADVSMEDESWNLVANAPIESAMTDPGTLLNARIAYTSPERLWQVALWGKNLGDEEYSRASTATDLSQFAAEPMLVGVDFHYHF